MEQISRTVYGAAVQTAINMGIPYAPSQYASLNTLFGIATAATPDANTNYETKFLVIGNGGHYSVAGADGFPQMASYNHQPTDAGCYNHLPFVLRPIDADLTIAERAKYALRREETHGGLQYYAYYAKRLDYTANVVSMKKTTLDPASTVDFVPTNTNLNPTPPETLLGSVNLIQSSNEYVSGSSVITIEFTATDAAELRNVSQIIYGDEDHAVISEIGLVTGIDKVVTGALNGGTVDYNEVIYAQIVVFIACYYNMVMQTDGFTTVADTGITEPLLIAAV